jgi:two-component system, OmpR family, response regulator ChvI
MRKRMVKILIVENERDVLRTFEKGLTYNGFEVEAFEDPLKALAKFMPNTYDVLILDIRMPTMNGFELYRELRKRGDKSIVFFITAFDVYYEEFKRIFPDVDVKHFIKKPILIKELAATIDRVLKAETAN